MIDLPEPDRETILNDLTHRMLADHGFLNARGMISHPKGIPASHVRQVARHMAEAIVLAVEQCEDDLDEEEGLVPSATPIQNAHPLPDAMRYIDTSPWARIPALRFIGEV